MKSWRDQQEPQFKNTTAEAVANYQGKVTRLPSHKPTTGYMRYAEAKRVKEATKQNHGSDSN